MPSLSRRSLQLIRLLLPVSLGVLLVAVPTVFAMFPGLTTWSRRTRVEIIIGWLVIALVGALLTALADARLHRLVAADQEAAVVAERRATIRDQFRGLLVPGIGGLPEQYHMTVYGPTPDRRFLIPLYPPALNFRDPAIFPTGAGATGKAWEDPTGVFVVTGDAVSSDRHGLTGVQQRRYKMFGTVAGVVIAGEAGQPIGVLTAIGRDEDGFFDQGGVEVLKDLAQGIAWLIPEAVRWMMPREGP